MTLWTPCDERGDKMTAIIGGHAATSSLNEVMEFDHVIRVLPNRQVDDDLAEVYAPEVYQDVDAEGSCLPDSDTHLIERLREQGWTAAVGYTGQYGYSGPVMHESEFVGGRLARDILDVPGLYVVCAVYPLPDRDQSGPFGWIVLYRSEEVTA